MFKNKSSINPGIIEGKEDSGAEGIMIDCEPTSCQELFGSVHMYRPFPDLASLTTPGRKTAQFEVSQKRFRFPSFYSF